MAVLTASRSEYYQLRTILQALQQSKILNLQLFVTGSHLSTQFGKSERDIAADGFLAAERLPILVDDGSGLGCASTAGLAVHSIASALQRNQTDLLLLLGDRFEILAAAMAASCVGVPIAHIHGGERTDGAFDDGFRHAVTKLSALHFVSTDVYRARVLQMGESPNHVFVVGAPLLDAVRSTILLSEEKVIGRLGMPCEHPIALVSYHPVTLDRNDDGRICELLLETVARHCKTIVITAPNNDPGYEAILEVMKQFAEKHKQAKLFANLGSQLFLSVMSLADLIVGNSSSGIHEAASFRLPCVNVGSRQASRLRPRNVLDCEPGQAAIEKTITTALSPEFKSSLSGLTNPYGDGKAGQRLVATLERFVPFKEHLLRKAFNDGAAVIEAETKWRNQNG